MNLERRIQKLERRFLDHGNGLILWEELCGVIGTVYPERRNDRSALVDMPRILASPPSPKVRRMIEAYRAKERSSPPTTHTELTKQAK
jgi:hypothetical protein